ncbi:polysaccharide biosynthesis/export family protein [Calditrichota bacterium]
MILFNKIILFIIILNILFIACSQQSKVRSRYQEATLKLKLFEQTQVPEYQLGFGDVVEIKFFNNDQFNETVAVRPDGRITMEKIGDIFVTGMTPLQLDTLITKTYADIILNPDVTVFVREFGGYRIYVLGEVNTPGGYPLERNMNLVQALATAGGLKSSAKLGNVMILRQGKKGEVKVIKIDVDGYLSGDITGLMSLNSSLQPHDIIYVTSTFFYDVTTFLKQVYDGLLPPVDLYLRAWYYSVYLDGR